MSLAYRIVGSHNDAEDAVQAAWLRARSADPAQLVNPEGWLTTVTARLCLDQLRARHRRREVPLKADDIPGEQLAADEAFVRREDGVVERVDSARLAFLETLWNRAVPDPTRARAAALLPHLLLIGANAIRPPLDAAGPPWSSRGADRGRARTASSVPRQGPATSKPGGA